MRYLFLLLFPLMMFSCSEKSEQSENSESSESSGLSEQSETAETADILLTARQLQTVGITLGPLEQRNLGATVRANGELRLDPQARAAVTPLVGGIVRRILVTEGQAVRAGQTLAYIENTEVVALQKDLATAQRELAYAEQELARQQELRDNRAGVEKNWQAARANRDLCRTRITGLQQQLSQLGVHASAKAQRQVAITAPISGTVTTIAAATGSFADAQLPLMTIADNGAVYAELKVFEKDLSSITVGQHVDIALTYQQDTHIAGTIAAVSRSIDPTTRAAAVRVTLPADQKADRRLGEGMTITGVISTDRQQVDALPDDAIVTDAGHHYAYVLDRKAADGYHFRRVEVITGQSDLGHTAVSLPRPVKAGTQFVRKGAFYIASASTDHGEEE